MSLFLRLLQNRGLTTHAPQLATSVLRSFRLFSSLKSGGLITLSKSCIKRLKGLQKPGKEPDAALRIAINSGGCSGLQYTFTVDQKSKRSPSDVVVEQDGALVLMDERTAKLMTGASVDFHDSVTKTEFVVTNNPMAQGSCSCGQSFVFQGAEGEDSPIAPATGDDKKCS